MEIYSDINEVTSFFLSKSSMTHKKLQKIIYYAYSWSLALLNDSEDKIENFLFREKFEGWVHGPVSPGLYQKYKVHGWDNIPKDNRNDFSFSEDVIDILEQVWDVYGSYSGNELEDISHQEEPWKESREYLSPFEPGDRMIKDETIYTYFNAMASR